MDKPEALRLADAIDPFVRAYAPDHLTSKVAAAELRRLSAVEAQRDALLEALRAFVSCALPVSTEIDERGHRWTQAYLDQALPTARAAIAKTTGGDNA